ncbi:MAG TPA: AraC family transcriptional regulator [Bacteroidales bacterium]|nr:AraC family transcriptional regulator [Bacteroidales bacterium]
MTIFVKNMVSTRCIIVVKATLEKLNISYDSVELGIVETSAIISNDKIRMLDQHLKPLGLELKENKKYALVDKIKSTILEIVNKSDDQIKITLSEYLSQKLGYNSTYLSNLFSEMQGISIEKYYISKKIEHVKRLLENDDLNLKEISYITNYSSVAHLSYQFKKITGVAPSEFRMMLNKHSMNLQEATL